MTQRTPRELFQKELITEEQFIKIDAISSGKIVSVYYELRTILYLGILLFTTGVGILIYKNIGDIGHIISMISLALLTAACFWYAFAKGPAYSHERVKPPSPYFDYIVLLGALLFISVLGYLQFLYEILDKNLGSTTLITATLFFYIAYRFDHLGVLSMAITALASFFSISVSPQNWYSGNLFDTANLHSTAIVFSIAVACFALFIDKREIKKHFTFTYLNFCCLIFFSGAITGLFMGDYWGLYLMLIYGGCAFAFYMARWKRSFLFLLYAFISAYIGTTYLLARTIMEDAIELWFLYSIASCAGFIIFIIKYKNYFNRES